MKKRKFKTVLVGIGLITLLSGCEHRTQWKYDWQTEEEIETTNEYYEEETEYASNDYIDNNIVENEITTEEITTEVTTEEIATEESVNVEAKPDTQQIIINSEPTTEKATEETINETNDMVESPVDIFGKEVEQLNVFYDQQTYDVALTYGKNLFVRMVDFIFYGTEINGTTFDELSEENKQQVFENLKVTDKILMSIKPDYKESLSEKYNIVKDFTTEKYHDALDLIKNKIGEEKYNNIKDKKDSLKDKASKTKKKTLEKVKNWYENFRE